MKRKTSLRTRVVAMLLAVVCIVGLIPTTAFAANTGTNTVPGTVTLKKADYHVTDAIKYDSGVLGECYVHEFYMNVNGSETVGFCADHSKRMGTSLTGHTWSNPEEITDKNVKLLLSYYYSYSEGKFSAAGEAAGLQPFDEFTAVWTQGWLQACVWLALNGSLPDYEADREGWIEAVATERMRLVNAYHDKGYSWAQHYTSIDDPDDLPDGTVTNEGDEGWTCRMAAAYILNNADMWGDWSIYRYAYAGPGSDAHPDPTTIQAIIVGIYNAEPDIPGNPCSLTIKKVDATNPNKTLQGAVFQVTATDGSFDKPYTTDENGLIEINSRNESGFGPGRYAITEIKAPSGYTISDTSTKYVEIDDNQNANVEFTYYDEPEITGGGSIRKVDADNPTVGLAGAVIKITGVDNGYTTEVITGAGGYVSADDFDFKDLPIGSYVAEEIGVPEGYSLNPDPDQNKQEFYWDGKSNIQLVFQNDSKVKVQLKKVDQSDNPLEGAIFNIYKDGQLIGTEATDAQGTITVPNVTEGFYYFVETDAPDGYAKMSQPVGTYVDQADIQGEETIVVTAKNYKSPELTIKKIDAATREPVPNTTFEIRGINVSYQNTITTGADGSYTLTGLPAGTYEVTELSVPAPYILDTNNRQSIVLDPGASRELTFENSTEPGLRIIKKDKLTGAPVPGVTFLIEKIDGSYSEEATTDDNGEIFIEHLEAGSYKVTEIRVPGNYILNDVPQTVTLEPNKTCSSRRWIRKATASRASSSMSR